MKPGESVEFLKGVGPAMASKFAVLGIKTLADLFEFLPRRYEDYSQVTPIARLQPGEVTIKAVIKSAKGRYVRRGMHVTEAAASDTSGSVRLIWFNQPYRETSVQTDTEYFISGTFALSHQRLAISNPSIERVSDMPINTARILPVYRETKGLNSRQVRNAVQQILPLIKTLSETLPAWLIEEQKLVSRAAAYELMHFPTTQQDLEIGRHRLGFEEVFRLTLASLLTKYELHTETAPSVIFEETVVKDFVSKLPFVLTDAQRKVAWQCYQDMQRTVPMNRLVEGDVGSGKTAVAALAALLVLHYGHQVALMAPTELLARQHADTLHNLLSPVGLNNTVGLLVGGMKPKQKEQARQHISAGHIRFLVGTHALIQDSVDMQKLELIVIDEQHRFGVEQRKKLMAKAGHMPHVLSLTATPIPRSLALTLYGEMDISILDQKPAGRQPIQTSIESPNSRPQLNEKIELQLQAGRQMFVVCPLISQSATLDVSSAEKTYQDFSKKYFKHRRVGLLHGKMKPDEKQWVMQQFIEHKLDILVSTTVIEVGVDVPNASIMLIEGAERFGLAQLHQLRGRTGRGVHQSYCYLMMSDSTAPGKRLRALERSQDGFKLAELDLQLRGPGAIYGRAQHGQLDLSVAKLTDVHLIAAARAAAQSFIDRAENLAAYPSLRQHVIQLQAVTNLN